MLLILTGPTCSGKTTVAKILEQDHDFSRLVTYTTRPKRENEVEGVDYYFVSEEEFRASMENNEFVEYRDYNALFGHVYYGSKVDAYCVKEGKYVIVLDPAGARKVKELYPDGDIYIIYLDVPEYTCYQRSLERGDDVQETLRRLKEDEIHEFIAFRKDKIPDYTIWGSPSTDVLVEMVLEQLKKVFDL